MVETLASHRPDDVCQPNRVIGRLRPRLLMNFATRKGEGRAREEARDAPKRRDTGGEGWMGGPLWVSCGPPGRIEPRGRGRPQGSPPHLRSSRVPTPPFPPFGRQISSGDGGASTLTPLIPRFDWKNSSGRGAASVPLNSRIRSENIIRPPPIPTPLPPLQSSWLL